MELSASSHKLIGIPAQRDFGTTRHCISSTDSSVMCRVCVDGMHAAVHTVHFFCFTLAIVNIIITTITVIIILIVEGAKLLQETYKYFTWTVHDALEQVIVPFTHHIQ